MVAENSHFPFPTNITVVPETTLVIRDDYTIFIGPDGVGSDTNGDGTDTKPYATLKKAWERAGEILIRGNATLYIRFQRGIYNITNSETFFPINLFHPNGDRIIIEGDPAQIKQQYVYRVQNYSWDYFNYSHYGHTGDVFVWGRTASSGTGTTAHGFTGSLTQSLTDIGRYVAISYPAMSTPDYYQDAQNNILLQRFEALDPGWDSAQFTRSFESYADMWYSHGKSHDTPLGIVGLAVIVGATADPNKLSLSFKNSNRDPRVPSFTDSSRGKIGGTLSNFNLFGIPANLPPAQQYSPNGYYGWTASTPSGVTYTTSYPTQPVGVPHVTHNPVLLSSYPAVLRINRSYTGSPNIGISPIRITGGKIKAIRNIAFVDEQFDGLSAGAQTTTFGFSGLHMANYTGERYTSPCFRLENSEVAIRHIGIHGFGDRASGSSIHLVNSKLTAFSDWIEYGMNTSGAATNVQDEHNRQSDTNASVVYARLGSGNNTPVLMVNSIRGAIYAENSQVSLVAGFDRSSHAQPRWASPFPASSRASEGVWMQTHAGTPIRLIRSHCDISSAIILNRTQYPAFSLRLNLPRFKGITMSTGNTTGIYSAEKWGLSAAWSYGPPSPSSSFKSVVLYADGVTIGRIIGALNTGETSNNTFSGSSFFPAGSGAVGSINMLYYGVRFGDPSLVNTLPDLQTYLTTNKKIEMIGYSDSAESITTSKLVIEGATIGVTTDNLTGLQLRSITPTSSLVQYDTSSGTLYGARPVLSSTGTNFPGTVINESTILLNNSTITLQKNLVVSGGACGVLAVNKSKLQTLNVANNSNTSYSCIMGEFFTDACLLAKSGSVISVSSLLTRHPDVVGGSGRVASVAADGLGSVVNLGSTCVLVTPTRVPSGATLWTSPSSPSTPALNGSAVSAVSARRHGAVSFGHVRTIQYQRDPKVFILSDGAAYSGTDTINEERRDTNLVQMEAVFGGIIAPFSDTTPTSALGTNGNTFGVLRNIGWSGPSYKLQVCQTDETKRFYNVSDTGRMYRFWNHPLGVSSSNSTLNTAFYSLPIVLSSNGTSYGESGVIESGNSTNYTSRISTPCLGTGRGYSGGFVHVGSDNKGGVFPYQIF